jgi:hypothetical protein
MSGERLPPWGYRDDDEMLTDLAQGLLEQEAERLIAALLAAETAAIALYPDLPAVLDANAAAYGEARDNWIADLRCGDLPADQANAHAIALGTLARNAMYGVVLGAVQMELRADDIEVRPEPEDTALVAEAPDDGVHREPERWALFKAAAAIHAFLANLDGDTHDDLAELRCRDTGRPSRPPLRPRSLS